MTSLPRLTCPLGSRLALGCALAALLQSGVSAADTSCPENRIIFTLALGVPQSTTSTLASLDLTSAYGHGSYDLTTGALGCTSSFYDPGFPLPRWAGSFVEANDDYWVVGLAPGTTVDFAAELTVSGSWSVYPGVPQGEFGVEAHVAVDPDTARYVIPLPGGCCHGTLSRVLALPLHRLSEQPFRLHVRLATLNYRGDVTESALLQFTGLPLGATVVNCHTAPYPVTPTMRSNWARVKALYR